MNQSWEPSILGELAEEGSISDQQSIFINKQNQLQFSIHIISTPPSSFPSEQQTVTAYGNDLEEYGFEDDGDSPLERIRKLEDFLADKLIVFQAEQRNGYYRTQSLKLIPKKNSFVSTAAFHPIPIFKEGVNANGSLAKFFQDLKQGAYIGRNDLISKEEEDTPRYILYETRDRHYYAIGEFDQHQYAYGGFNFQSKDDIAFIPVEKDVYKEFYFSQTLAFIGDDEEDLLLNALQSAEAKSVDEFTEQKVVEVEQVKEKEVVQQKVSTMKASELTPTPLPVSGDFMERFIAATKARQLVYKEEDLYNFYTCLSTGKLTVLTGLSGVGKLQLIYAFKQAMALENHHFLTVSVKANWLSEEALLGHVDVTNNVYRPATTGIVNVLIEAAKNPQQSYLICFDGMNLATVEHYFAQFLAILELPVEERKLLLYHPDFEEKLYNGPLYPASIPVGDNVCFVATAQTGEHVRPFSERLLDRVNWMTLQIESFKKLAAITSLSLTETELDFLWELHEVLQTVSPQLGVSPRIVKEMNAYIESLAAVKNSPIDRKKALDLQIAQRILPKIRGTEQLLQEGIGFYNEGEKVVDNSKIIALFDKYAALSHFERSRMLVVEKAKELVLNGYIL